MKRYLVFKGIEDYPQGGWGDFLDHFDTFEEAETAAANIDRENLEWAHIVDTKTMTIVDPNKVGFTVMLSGQQESEGNPTKIQTYATKKAAQDWIDAQIGEYYSPGQYFIRRG